MASILSRPQWVNAFNDILISQKLYFGIICATVCNITEQILSQPSLIGFQFVKFYSMVGGVEAMEINVKHAWKIMHLMLYNPLKFEKYFEI